METTFLLRKLEKFNVLLASKSPRRQELLAQLGISFAVCNSFVNETVPQGLSVHDTAQYLAQQKAEAVFAMYKKQKELIVIGGDTLVTLDNEIMGKPANRKEAFRMLKKLSGKQHAVISGISVVTHKKILTKYDEALVSFNDLSDEDICYYVDKFMPYDKAGAYGIQEWIGCRGIRKIEGSFFTIMGFPTHLVWNMLEEIIL